MKILKTLTFLVLAGASALASARTIEMEVNGLVCAFCAQGISKSMKAFPASDGVFVSLEHRLVAVHLKDGQDIADAALRKAITDAGYKLVAVRRTDATLEEIKARAARNKGKPMPKDPHGHGAGDTMKDMHHDG